MSNARCSGTPGDVGLHVIRWLAACHTYSVGCDRLRGVFLYSLPKNLRVGLKQKVIVIRHTLWVFPVVIQNVVQRALGAVILFPTVGHMDSNDAFKDMCRHLNLWLSSPRMRVANFLKGLQRQSANWVNVQKKAKTTANVQQQDGPRIS